MKLIYFDILPDEGLQFFYFWRIFDGSYNKLEQEDEAIVGSASLPDAPTNQKASPANDPKRRLLLSKKGRKMQEEDAILV